MNTTASKTTPNKEAKAMSTTAKKDNAFAGAADAMGAGIDALFGNSQGPLPIMVNLDDIEIKKQIREEFESDGDELADLGKSLRKRQLQAIVLTANAPGSAKPYLLVAGERRVRGARIEGLSQLRAVVEDMTPEEAEDAQLAENIHRKNLTQVEEAKKIQRDLDELGSVDAVLEKHQKGHSWLSKILSLLSLPEQAKRLVSERVTADLEVINAVKTIEKIDPAKAKALVDDLKATRGKANARDKVAAVKEAVKPSKKAKTPEKTPKWLEQQRAEQASRAAGGTMATAKDRTHEQPSATDVFVGAHAGKARKFASLPELMNQIYTSIFEKGNNPKTVLDSLADEDREEVEGFLLAFYDAGKQSKDLGRAVIQGFRNGQFSSDGDGAFGLVAFLQGADSEAKFNLLNIFGSAKE